jgi:hypothetical protein
MGLVHDENQEGATVKGGRGISGGICVEAWHMRELLVTLVLEGEGGEILRWIDISNGLLTSWYVISLCVLSLRLRYFCSL